jgi:hypothetical protein
VTSSAEKDTLIQNLDRVVRDVLAFFDGAGRVSQARIDRWGARDVLMHFIYFHQATAWGIQSAATGGPPWLLPGDADTVNEVCRQLHEHESFDDLLTQLRLAHGQLLHAARNSPDLDRPCFRRANGELMTARQRLELITRHWNEHVRELQAAG